MTSRPECTRWKYVASSSMLFLVAQNIQPGCLPPQCGLGRNIGAFFYGGFQLLLAESASEPLKPCSGLCSVPYEKPSSESGTAMPSRVIIACTEELFEILIKRVSFLMNDLLAGGFFFPAVAAHAGGAVYIGFVLRSVFLNPADTLTSPYGRHCPRAHLFHTQHHSL